VELIQIGKISKPHGFRGDCLATSLSGRDSAFSYLKKVYIGKAKNATQAVNLTKVAWMPKGWKLTLEGIDSEEKVNVLRDSLIFASREDLKETSENEYYILDLEGCTAFDASTKNPIGTFISSEEVLSNSQQNRWWFKDKNGKEFSIPAVKRYIEKVDVEKKEIWLLNLSDFADDE